MKKRKKAVFVLAVPVVLFGIVGWYLFLGSRITDSSSEIIAGKDGTRSLIVYFSRTGEIPDAVDAVASATPNSNQAMDGSDTEAAAKMLQELTGADLYQIRRERYYRSAFWGTAATAWIEETLNLRPGLAAQPEDLDEFEPVVEQRLPVYFAIGRNDEYYGLEPTQEAYDTLHALYEQQGLTAAEIDGLLVLDVKEHGYFTDRGMAGEHGGGLFAYDEEIMGWLFSH